MRNVAFLSLVVVAVTHVALLAQSDYSSEDSRQVTQEERGRISGVVLDSATGKPIVGAYVGIGDFGDSGGSNYSRHRQQGLFAKAQTDQQGRFVLDGLAFQDHPLIVTHPGFIRHDQMLTLRKGMLEPDVGVALRPAAEINVAIVDSSGKPLEGFWLFRLEALDGHKFIPPGRDPHLSTFASSVWIERPKSSLLSSKAFSFTELNSGEYSVEIMKFARSDDTAPAPSGMMRIPLDTSDVSYYGGIAKLIAEAGQIKAVRVKPADYQTSVTIKVPQNPVKNQQIPPFVFISRNVGLLLWNDGKAHHPEDHRLGRLQKNALYYNMVIDGDVLKIKNLPPGSYSVFAGPVYFMSAVRMEVSSGREVIVELPSITPSEQARVNLWTFDRKIMLEDDQYGVSQLCALVSAKTDSNPRLVADPSIENERLELGNREATIWELMEAVYLARGWKLIEQGDRTLLLCPGE
jgi:hypothetical protein